MKKTLLCLAAALIIAFPVLADEAIWVDGNGGILDANGVVRTYIDVDRSRTNTVPTDSDGEDEDPEVPEYSETQTTPAAPSNKWVYTPTQLTATYEGRTVEVVHLNSCLSTIRVGRERQTVRTSELAFDTEAAEGKRLAMINTPKSGRAAMFKRASSKAGIIYKCQTNRIVTVQSVGKRFVKLHYADADGYVAAKSVTYLAPWEGDIQVATIAYKGNPKTRTTVKVRQKPSGSSRVLDEYRCGTQVVVLGQSGKWTEIEVENLHCFILTEFLTEPVAWLSPSMMAAKEE